MKITQSTKKKQLNKYNIHKQNKKLKKNNKSNKSKKSKIKLYNPKQLSLKHKINNKNKYILEQFNKLYRDLYLLSYLNSFLYKIRKEKNCQYHKKNIITQIPNSSNNLNKSNKLKQQLFLKYFLDKQLRDIVLDKLKQQKLIEPINYYVKYKQYNKIKNLGLENKLLYNLQGGFLGLDKAAKELEFNKPENVEGGPYLMRLTEKGDKPITGDDMKKTLEEIIKILEDLRYLDDAKEAYGPTVLLNYFTGNVDDLKSYFKFKFFPKFYSTNPPMIKFGEIFKRWDNIVDILNVYKNDKKIKKEWAVEKGLKPEDVLKPGFLDKFADKLDSLDQKFQKAKRLKNRQFTL